MTEVGICDGCANAPQIGPVICFPSAVKTIFPAKTWLVTTLSNSISSAYNVSSDSRWHCQCFSSNETCSSARNYDLGSCAWVEKHLWRNDASFSRIICRGMVYRYGKLKCFMGGWHPPSSPINSSTAWKEFSVCTVATNSQKLKNRVH